MASGQGIKCAKRMLSTAAARRVARGRMASVSIGGRAQSTMSPPHAPMFPWGSIHQQHPPSNGGGGGAPAAAGDRGVEAVPAGTRGRQVVEAHLAQDLLGGAQR